VNQFGVWVLLLSWLPLVGDVLCFVAGAAKLPVVQSSLLMLIGKLARYSILVVLANAYAGVN
jgi:membrane protein YqaA with SNARE-associated domain